MKGKGCEWQSPHKKRKVIRLWGGVSFHPTRDSSCVLGKRLLTQNSGGLSLLIHTFIFLLVMLYYSVWRKILASTGTRLPHCHHKIGSTFPPGLKERIPTSAEEAS